MSNNKSIVSFGETIQNKQFKVLNERALRASSGMMLFLGAIAIVNGFVLSKFIVIPYISGFLLLNFLIGIFINPKFAPLMFIANRIVKKQDPIWIGAIQKKFAWGLGLVLATAIFGLSLLLVGNHLYFGPVCMLCMICLLILFFETAFGICVGCKFYYLAIRLKLIKEPKVKPNCMGDSCDV